MQQYQYYTIKKYNYIKYADTVLTIKNIPCL